MKMKKVIIGFIFSLFLLSLLSSCAIDRKCPAYSRLTDSYYLDADARKVMLQQYIYHFGK